MSGEEGSKDTDRIDAMPTKAFFVDMLTKDIPLERAVLDLVDNCIDGAKRLRDPDEADFKGLWVKIEISADRFEISDNCGGFDSKTAKEYAFRFGRPRQAGSTAYSIGQFGVGMKRALFKFGRAFSIQSVTANEKWAVNVDVTEWEEAPEWSFGFSEKGHAGAPPDERGTTIKVWNLRPEVAARFGSEGFRRNLRELIRIHQRQFIAKGLNVEFEGSLSATDLNLLVGEVDPAVEAFSVGEGEEEVKVRLIAGVGDSLPNSAGWYVVCNGRVVLAADRSDATGWGRVSEGEADIPRYHNQYARFRGIAFFDCKDSRFLPWNTTKTGVDADNKVWAIAIEKMVVMARAVVDFLNELDSEKRDVGSDGPLQRALNASSPRQAEAISKPTAFRVPDREKYSGPRMTRIAYSKPADKVRFLMVALGVGSAKAVGEKTFDAILREQEE